MVQDTLQSRIEALAREARLAQESRRGDLEKEMSRREDGDTRLDEFAGDWLARVVLPKLQAVVNLFPNGAVSYLPESPRHVSLVLTHTDEFPATARVDTAFAPGLDASRPRLEIRVIILPILIDYGAGSGVDVDLANPETDKLEAFVDDQIVRFVADSLRIAQADSPDQRDRQVTDPVCGMMFHRREAAASTQYEHRTYYFCARKCVERFEAAPRTYVHT